VEGKPPPPPPWRERPAFQHGSPDWDGEATSATTFNPWLSPLPTNPPLNAIPAAQTRPRRRPHGVHLRRRLRLTTVTNPPWVGGLTWEYIRPARPPPPETDFTGRELTTATTRRHDSSVASTGPASCRVTGPPGPGHQPRHETRVTKPSTNTTPLSSGSRPQKGHRPDWILVIRPGLIGRGVAETCNGRSPETATTNSAEERDRNSEWSVSEWAYDVAGKAH